VVVETKRALLKNSTTNIIFLIQKKKKVSDDYDILQKLGVGSFGSVKKGRSKKSGDIVAIKSCKKLQNPTHLILEVEILKLAQGYEGIVRMFDVYETEKKVEIVMEYIKGGELFDKIVELEFYSEKDAAGLVKQMVDAVHYCHVKNIVHRDLKPENLMFADDNSNVLKLIDFGVSAILRNETDKLYDRVGTRTYMAPEVVKCEGYRKQCDMFSIGVIMYILLAGYPPFDPEEGIVELEFPSPDWDGISGDAIKIIKNLLSDNPDDRMNIEQLKNTRWVSGREINDISLKRKGTINSLRQYNDYRKVGQSMTASRASVNSQRFSAFGVLGLQEGKNNVRKERGSFSLNDTELSGKIKDELRDITDLFDLLTEDLMALSLRGKNQEKKRQFGQAANDIDTITTIFKDIKEGFIQKMTK
jgi:serine/threonine protein kinase